MAGDSKRARLDGGGLMSAARKSFSNLRSFFASQDTAVELRAKEHETVRRDAPEGRFVPRHVTMDPITKNAARLQSFDRVFAKIEAAVSRSNRDLRCNSAECATEAGEIEAGRAYVVKLRYGPVTTYSTAEPFVLDLESFWSVPNFDADPALKTITVPFALSPAVSPAGELEFSLFFRGAPPEDE